MASTHDEPVRNPDVDPDHTVDFELVDEEPHEIGTNPLQPEVDHRSRILAFAEEHDLDYPTAWSVVAGLVSLDEALGLMIPSVDGTEEDKDTYRPGEYVPTSFEAHEPTLGDHPDDPGSKKPTFDRGFLQAVSDGCLSVQEAVERGDRMVYAEQIAHRHVLPMVVALQITDKRISLRDALRRRGRSVGRDGKFRIIENVRPEATPGQKALVTILGFAMFLSIGMFAAAKWTSSVDVQANSEPVRTVGAAFPGPQRPVAPPTQDRTPAPQAPPPVALVEIVKSTEGYPVQVSGPTPDHVLRAFCSYTGDLFEPAGVKPPDPKFQNSRLGLVRPSEDPARLHGLPMRKDTKTFRWVAGNGHDAIVVTPVSVAPR